MARPSDAIVVLGAAQYAGRPSPVLRLDSTTPRPLEKGMARRLVLTGGRGTVIPQRSSGRPQVRDESRRGGQRDPARERGKNDEVRRLTSSRGSWKRNRLERAILVSDPFPHVAIADTGEANWGRISDITDETSPISANRLEAFAYIMSESVKVPATIVLGFLGR